MLGRYVAARYMESVQEDGPATDNPRMGNERRTKDGEGSLLRALAGLALVPYALRGLGSLLILGVIAIGVVSALLLLLF